MDLLQELLRARALEDLLAARAPRVGAFDRGRVSVSPAVPAARALHRARDGSGDVFSARIGAPAAALTLGIDPRVLVRQALGSATAPAAGRSPGGFPTDLDLGLLEPVELPGILVEVMAGVALAFRVRGEARVALLVDDMAGSASGDWHEGLNLAAVREVPMVLVVDHAVGGPMDAPVAEMGARAAAYGFGSHRVDGTDPRAVEKVVWNAVEAARAGDGLQVVDVAPPSSDPVQWLAESLIAAEAITAEALAAAVGTAEEEMRRALEEVESEPQPDPALVRPSPGLSGRVPSSSTVTE